MARIQLPERFRNRLGLSVAMDLHVIDIILTDGQKLKKLAVRDGQFITGFAADENGESDLGFDSEDIVDVKKSRFWPL